MRWFLALVLCLQLTPSFACTFGARTFDFALFGRDDKFAKGTVLVIGRVLDVVPTDEEGTYDATIEVLKPYSDDPRFAPSTKVVALALFSNCGERVASGYIGLYAIRQGSNGLELASRHY
jgi:hypothetical protein